MMSQLLIEIDSPENEALLLALLPKLDGRLIEKKDKLPKESLAQVLDRIAQIGGIGGQFGDGSDWQREIRSWDRVIDGREE